MLIEDCYDKSVDAPASTLFDKLMKKIARYLLY
jgi:hypothetical protein